MYYIHCFGVTQRKLHDTRQSKQHNVASIWDFHLVSDERYYCYYFVDSLYTFKYSKRFLEVLILICRGDILIARQWKILVERLCDLIDILEICSYICFP